MTWFVIVAFFGFVAFSFLAGKWADWQYESMSLCELAEMKRRERERARQTRPRDHRLRPGSLDAVFDNPANSVVLDDLVKAGYRDLARKRHPDTGGRHVDMQRLNNVVQALRKATKGGGKG